MRSGLYAPRISASFGTRHCALKRGALNPSNVFVTITAKNLATEITNFNVKKENLNGENIITSEHVKNNTKVRGILIESGIVPETLPSEEDIKKLGRIVSKEEKKIANKSRHKKILN
ncbi:hypothetical protein J4417_00025 [Candidatus Woesearchaeota archaeon]|nr:hypothetical protein [Candidatus Woesearchaeota archaeon]